MKKLLHFVNPVYNVNVLQSENGSVSASPISGTCGTEVTLTNTPDEGYVFDKYELTGATLYDGNKFKIKKYDVNVQGLFKIPYSVTIGSQIWKSKNLDIDDGQGGIITQTVNYGKGNVTEYYYTWDAAARVASTVQGWHLPTTAEWDLLATTVGGSSTAGTYLKSSYGWSSGNGTDDYGFCALPAGTYLNSFGNFGTAAYFWTADQISATYGYNRYFGTNASMNSNTSLTKSWKLSVRLIKDA